MGAYGDSNGHEVAERAEYNTRTHKIDEADLNEGDATDNAESTKDERKVTGSARARDEEDATDSTQSTARKGDESEMGRSNENLVPNAQENQLTPRRPAIDNESDDRVQGSEGKAKRCEAKHVRW
ncbi:hypothetical protein K438DRAFT_1765369 [Mycena galopus ATCC 62051]|nr:hypothetical protein K438DRAFT_1765369 [Mycena galopus ATCC 62051]